MIVLGLKCFSHDTGAAILADDGGSLRLHAISEARLNRRKHSFAYPLMSIAYCLKALGLESLDEVDAICIDRHMEVWPESNSQFGYDRALRRHHPRYDDVFRWGYLIEQTMRWPAGKVHWINHIDAHAASAFFVSPFERAALLSLDGLGDFASGMWGMGEGNRLRVTGSVAFPHSLGMYYTAVTQYLGFPKAMAWATEIASSPSDCI